jgi:hypothetical protein
MTWAEFKAAVEAAGVKDTDEVFSIDVTAPLDNFAVIVKHCHDGSLKITEDW